MLGLKLGRGVSEGGEQEGGESLQPAQVGGMKPIREREWTKVWRWCLQRKKGMGRSVLRAW